MVIKFCLSNLNRSIKIVVEQSRIQEPRDCGLIGKSVQAAQCRLPAVEVEDEHGFLATHLFVFVVHLPHHNHSGTKMLSLISVSL